MARGNAAFRHRTYSGGATDPASATNAAGSPFPIYSGAHSMPRGVYKRKKTAKRLPPEFQEVAELSPTEQENFRLKQEIADLRDKNSELERMVFRLVSKIIN